MELEQLLERTLELDDLGRALDEARRGRGSLVLIEGLPGAGKSRLLHAARDRAGAAGFTILAARGTQLEREFPFGVARQLLGGRMPEPDERGDLPLQMIVELAATVAALADAAPLLLTVDDLQWADRPSLRFLAYLTQRLATVPVTFVGAWRTGEPDVPDELLDALRAVPETRTLQPAPLSDAAVRTLAQRTFAPDVDAAFCHACAAATGGNPFYVRELLRALREEGPDARAERVRGVVPTSVLRAVMRRVAWLGPEAAALAAAATVLGDGAELGVAAGLAGLETEAAERAADALARAQVIAPGEPLRFAHPLIASALYADLGTFAAARAHRRAAELLIELHASTERIAAHLLLSRPEADDAVLAPLRAAAASAVARGEPAAAARLLERALAEPPSPARRADVLLELAGAEALAGTPDAVGHMEEGLALIDEPKRRGETLASLTGIMARTGDFARAVAFAKRARDELPADDPLQPRLLAAIIGAGRLHPPLAAELHALLDPLADAARAGHPPTEPALLAHLALHLGATDGSATLVRALVEAAVAGDPLVDAESHGASFGFAVSALLFTDELVNAERILDAALAEAERRGAILATSSASWAQASVHYYRGRLDASVVASERALETYRDGWAPVPWSAPTLALAQLARGDLDAAAAAIALADGADRDRVEQTLVLAARSELALARGDAAAALAAALAAGTHVEQRFGPSSARVHDWRRLAALAAHRLGDRAQAERLLAPALAELRASGPARQLGAVLHAAGLIAGDGPDGLALLSEAVATLERSPARLFLAHALVDLGAARRRAGLRTAAREPLYRALELADGFGATPLAVRARGELRPLGARPRRASRSGLGALTPSEWRVAGLAADGLTTRVMAERLTLSPKTIQTHLAHIYRKLDVRTRAELPDAIGRESPSNGDGRRRGAPPAVLSPGEGAEGARRP